MRILFLGDVIGNPGCSKIKNNLPDQIIQNKIDFGLSPPTIKSTELGSGKFAK